MEVVCSGCKQPIDIEGVKTPRIVNTAGVSVIVIEHSEHAFCAQCEKPMALFVTGCQLIGMAAPVRPEEQKRLVVVPNGG